MSNTEIQTWRELLDRKARHLHEQIAQTFAWVEKHAGGDAAIADNMTRELYDWLRELYEKELPLVKILDEADLSLELRGPDTAVSHPRISLVTSTFHRVQNQVRSVTRSIPGITEQSTEKLKQRHSFAHDMDLGFASMALNHALRVGFTLPVPGEGNCLGPEDPGLQAVAQAIDSIRAVSLTMSELENEQEIQSKVSDRIPDPKVRDSAILAVKELTPSGKSGLEAVRIYGRGDKPDEMEKPLTTESRKTLNQFIAKPVYTDEEMEIEGLVREMDLDKKRFELRQIGAAGVNDLRCVYGKEAGDSVAKEWLNDSIVVIGRVQKDKDGRPRLMRVTKLRSKGQKAGGKQMEIKFEDER